MAMQFKPVKRFNPFKPGDPEKYYSIPVYKETVSLREIAKEISLKTSLSVPDSFAFLEALTQILPNYLTEGHIVKLGEFGTFRISFKSESAKTPESFSSSKIKGFKFLFKPGKEMTNRLKEIEFSRKKP